MAQSPNGFTESLLKNTKGVDWMNIFFGNDLLENITVHEYFTKDWIKIPELSDNVSGYENNAAIKNGYAKMFTNFNKDLQFKIDQSQTEIKNLAKQGGDLFAMDMSAGAGGVRGNTFISTPARIIVHIITLKLIKLSNNYAEIIEYISELKNTLLQQKINAGKNSTCEVIDVMNNEFLADVNQKTRGVRALFIEDYRKWLNAYCTWVWYHRAYVKGFAMSQMSEFYKVLR